MKIKLVPANSFREAALKNESSELGVLKATSGTMKAIDKEQRIITFAITTESVDREGDVVRLNGWDLKSYKQNAVVLWAHGHQLPPVARSLRTYKAEAAGGIKALMSDAQFPERDLHEFGFMVFRLYEHKYLNATSVGFIPRAYEYRRDPENEQRIVGLEFTKQELLEYSAVPVPANPEALVQARSVGIDITPMKAWAEQVLDESKSVGAFTMPMPRANVERALKIASNEKLVTGGTTNITPEKQAEILAENLRRVRGEPALEERDASVADLLFGEDISIEVDLPAAEDEPTGEADATTTDDEQLDTVGADEGAGDSEDGGVAESVEHDETEPSESADEGDGETSTDDGAAEDAIVSASEDATTEPAEGAGQELAEDSVVEAGDTEQGSEVIENLPDDMEVTEADIEALVAAMVSDSEEELGTKELNEELKQLLTEAGITEAEFRDMLSAAFKEAFNKARGRLD